MSWLQKLNPFKKPEAPTAPAAEMPAIPGLPRLPPELAGDPAAKGMMGTLLRKWKDPAFLKQMRTLALHMRRDGVDVKDFAAVKGWMETNKERIESGAFAEEPAKPGETYVKTTPEVGRNEPCHCGSGKKFKKCHGR